MRRKRIFYIALFSLLLLGGAALCITRWKAWFANVPEPVYQVPAAPSCITLTLGEDALSQRVVSWRADTVLRPSGLILCRPDCSLDTFPAVGRIVASRSGSAAFYSVALDSLSEGLYTYSVFSGSLASPWQPFSITRSDTLRFFLFGDIQEKDTLSPFSSFIESLAHYSLLTSSLASAHYSLSPASTDGLPAIMCYVGDIIERPTDDYWQIWFRSMHGLQASVPQLAVPGNHEYLKGVRKCLDSRFTSVFVNPLNGPSRFRGTTCYVDYPWLRLILIDTDALQRFSDYTVTQTWLEKTLQEAGDRWTIVIMHHPVHSAGMFRDNPAVHLFFRNTLRHADLVFAGHDHNYARRCDSRDSVLFAPVTVVTSSASKCYIPKCSKADQRIGSNRAFYEDILVTPDSLIVTTRLLPSVTSSSSDSLPSPLAASAALTSPSGAHSSLLTPHSSLFYDRFTLYDRPVTVTTTSRLRALMGPSVTHSLVSVADSLPAEIIELPDKYKDVNSVAVRRFYNRRDHRLSK